MVIVVTFTVTSALVIEMERRAPVDFVSRREDMRRTSNRIWKSFLSRRPVRSWCGNAPVLSETDPICLAVLNNDLVELKRLVQAGNSVNIKTVHRDLLLNVVIGCGKREIFDYLMTLEELDVNILDRLNENPLICLIKDCFDEYYARKLIEKGADIHATDKAGNNLLHLSIIRAEYHKNFGTQLFLVPKGANIYPTDDRLEIGRIIIEKGVDINHREQNGFTPLYLACRSMNIDWICMLLYYGADVTIPSDTGVLPISVLYERFSKNNNLLDDILFNYTFDNLEKTIQLPSLVRSLLTGDSILFPKILQHITEIHYDLSDLEKFSNSLILENLDNLKAFMKKFPLIVEEMLENFPTLDTLLEQPMRFPLIFGLKRILLCFLHSDYVDKFVQSTKSNTLICDLHKALKVQDDSATLEEFTEIVTIMLTYGLRVTSADMDLIYECYGYCELFQILLHMEIIPVDQPQSIARVYYDPFATIDTFNLNSENVQPLISFYNHPKLKEFILKKHSPNDEIVKKVLLLPQVPLLVELSRNASRRFIVEKFSVKNSMQFNTIMKRLPIGDKNRKILTLEKELY